MNPMRIKANWNPRWEYLSRSVGAFPMTRDLPRGNSAPFRAESHSAGLARSPNWRERLEADSTPGKGKFSQVRLDSGPVLRILLFRTRGGSADGGKGGLSPGPSDPINLRYPLSWGVEILSAGMLPSPMSSSDK